MSKSNVGYVVIYRHTEGRDYDVVGFIFNSEEEAYQYIANE
jgi:hypothetical protein